MTFFTLIWVVRNWTNNGQHQFAQFLGVQLIFSSINFLFVHY